MPYTTTLFSAQNKTDNDNVQEVIRDNGDCSISLKPVAMKPVALVVNGEPPYIVSVMWLYIIGWRRCASLHSNLCTLTFVVKREGLPYIGGQFERALLHWWFMVKCPLTDR